MVAYDRFVLPNGLTALVHTDHSTPLVALNVLVRAGSRYDFPGSSGLAHLFEHLMFSGTELVPDFDVPMQIAGGENNAYTNADYASYYCYGPVENIETFLWLEYNRLTTLDISEAKLQLEKRVVLEEYRETCLNEPFGDLWHHLLPAAYGDHPYRWPTIGECEDDIRNISLSDVQKFRMQRYHPENMIVTLAGGIDAAEGADLVSKWFADLSRRSETEFQYQETSLQFTSQEILLENAVPVDAFYLAMPMPDRNHVDFVTLDLLTEILATGRSSVLYRNLIRGKSMLSQVDCYLSGALEGGLIIIEGKLAPGFDFGEVYAEIWQVIHELKNQPISKEVMARLKNMWETTYALSEMNILNKAMNLSYYEMLGSVDLINSEQDLYLSKTSADVMDVLAKYFREDRVITIEYRPKK